MAVAFDSGSAGVTSATTSSTSVSLTHTMSAGSTFNTTLGLVFLWSHLGSGANTVIQPYPVVTWGGVTCFPIDRFHFGATVYFPALHVYGVWAPLTGAQTVSATGFTSGNQKMYSAIYTGVRSVAVREKFENGSNTQSAGNFGTAAVPSQTGNMVVGMFGVGGGTTASPAWTTVNNFGTSRYNATGITTGTQVSQRPAALVADWSGSTTVTPNARMNVAGNYCSILSLDLVAVNAPVAEIGLIDAPALRGNRTTGTSSTLGTSWTHQVTKTVGSSDCVFVGVEMSISTNNTGSTCAVSFGGVSMTQLSFAESGSSTNRQAMGIYYLQNPPTGSNTVSVTTGGTPTKVSVAGASANFSNVGTINTPVTGSATSTDHEITVTGSTSADMQFGVTAASLAPYDASMGNWSANTAGVKDASGLYYAGSSVSGTGDYATIRFKPGTNTSIGGSASASTAWVSMATRVQSTLDIVPISTLVDSFSGGSTTPDPTLWTTTGTAVVDTTNHRLSMTGAGGTISSLVNYDLTGGAVSVGPANVTSVSATSAIWTPIQLTNSAGIALYIQVNALTGVATAYKAISTSVGSTRTHTNGDWYRIRESAGTVYWDVSTTGTGWTNWTSTPTTSITQLAFTVGHTATGGAASLSWNVDNVNVTPPGPAISTLVEDFSNPAYDGSLDPVKWDASSTAQQIYKQLHVQGSEGIQTLSSYDITSDNVYWQVKGGVGANVQDGSPTYVVVCTHGPLTDGVGFTFSNDGAGGVTVGGFGPGTTGSTVAHAYWNWYRIREASGTLYVEYSANRSSWTTLDSTTVVAAGLTKTNVVWTCVNAGSTAVHQIDNVNYPEVIASASTLSDDFSTGSTSNPAIWDDGGTSVPLTAEAAVVSAGNVLTTVEPYGLTGTAFWAQVKVGATDASLNLLYPSGIYVGGGFTGVFVIGWTMTGSTTMVVNRQDGTTTASTAHTDGNYYRIRESSGVWYWDWSTNGSSWTNAYSESVAAIPAREVFLSLGAGSAAPATFDNVNVVGTVATNTGAFFAMF